MVFMDLISGWDDHKFAAQDELLGLPLEFFFGLILVTLTSTTLRSEIKPLFAKVVNIPVTGLRRWRDFASCKNVVWLGMNQVAPPDAVLQE